MAYDVSARLTAATLRRFGVMAGAALGVLATLLWRRGGVVFPIAMGAMGAVLAATGMIVPASLRRIYAAWMALAALLPRVTTPLILGILFFLVITPLGLLMRLVGRNPLRHSSPTGTYWIDRPAGRRRSALDRPF